MNGVLRRINPVLIFTFLLISDLGMPEMDGHNLIKLLRAMSKEEGGEIPAIALTAYAGESDRDRVLAAGFQKHITKPV